VILHAIAVVCIVALASVIALAWLMRPVDDASVRWTASLRTSHVIVAMIVGAAAAFTIGPQVGAALLLGSYIIGRILKIWFERARGGITGSGLLLSTVLFGGSAAGILSALWGLW